tara:strand:- start:1317 stop:2675 length:1359 start_codon:yes stop_codon:yes gene_type:complete
MEQEAYTVFQGIYNKVIALTDDDSGDRSRNLLKLKNAYAQEDGALGGFVSLYGQIDVQRQQDYFDIASMPLTKTMIDETSGAREALDYLNSSTGFVSTLQDQGDKSNIRSLMGKLLVNKIAFGVYKDMDPEEMVAKLHTELFPDTYVLETGLPLNIPISKSLAEAFGITGNGELKEKFGDASELMVRQLVLQEGWSYQKTTDVTPQVEAQVNGMLNSKTGLANILSKGIDSLTNTYNIEGSVDKKVEKQQKQEALQGDSASITFAPIPSKNGKGYMLGIYNYDEDSPKNSILIGHMFQNGKAYELTDKQFASFAQSNKIVNYLHSHRVQAPLSHEFIRDTYKDAIERSESNTIKPSKSDWSLINAFEDAGQLELDYALRPLLDLLDKAAKEKGVVNLSVKETDKVLDDFLHNQDRWYQMFPQFIQPFFETMSNSYFSHELDPNLQLFKKIYR